MFLFQCRTFPNNYWDKFVKRKVGFSDSFDSKCQRCSSYCSEMTPVCDSQVLDKYGDIYGRERIAELLGMDLASLDVSAMTHEKKPEPDTSMFSWYVRCCTVFTYTSEVCSTYSGISQQACLSVCRITSIDIKYQIWKFGVVFTDNVS